MSLRVTTGMTSRAVLQDIYRAQANFAATQRKLSSGKEITKPSDDPYGTSKSLALRAQLEGTRQYQRNVQDAIGWLTTTDEALGSIGDDGRRARELLIQGATGTASAGAREAIAAELDELADSLKNTANASYRGRFVLAGTASNVRPYAVADTYSGDNGMVAREVGAGVSVPINVVAGDLLGSGGGDGKLLAVIRDAAAKLRSGTDADLAAVRATNLAALDANLDLVSNARSVTGARMQRLDSATARLHQLEELVTVQVSETEDVDFAKAAIDFNSQHAAYQAALKSGSKLVEMSLLDFLR